MILIPCTEVLRVAHSNSALHHRVSSIIHIHLTPHPPVEETKVDEAGRENMERQRRTHVQNQHSILTLSSFTLGSGYYPDESYNEVYAEEVPLARAPDYRGKPC